MCNNRKVLGEKVKKNSSVFKMQSSCCSTRSRNQSPWVTHHKFPTDDESLEAMKSLEAFIEFRTLFLSFIRFSNRIDRSKTKILKKRPNATQVLKNRRLLSSAVPSVWPNLPKVPAQVVVKQRVHDGMRKKCYFIAVRQILNS